MQVSIHTPIQGVTESGISYVISYSFNPHTHTGCDVTLRITQIVTLSFNPHTHTGCDLFKPLAIGH